MGEKAARRSAAELIPLFAVQQSLMFDAVHEAFGLRDRNAFDDLSYALSDMSIVEQEGEPDEPQPRSPSARRAEGYRLAVGMRDSAISLLQSLDALDEAMGRFNGDVIGRDNALLSEIFDIGSDDLDTGYLPESIGILNCLHGEADWGAIRSALEKVARLPVKDKLPRGPMRNVSLRRAVCACRDYWRGIEGKSWSMAALKHAGARFENNPDNLSGICEIFVVGMLRAHCVRHSLQEVSSAWVGVDREG